MNIIGPYAYFQLEALYLYQIYCDFRGSFHHFTMHSPLVLPERSKSAVPVSLRMRRWTAFELNQSRLE